MKVETTNNVEELLHDAAVTMAQLPKNYNGLRRPAVYSKKDLKDKYIPSSLEIDRLDYVLDRLYQMKMSDRDLLWARACGATWKELSCQTNLCHVTLRKRYAQSLGRFGHSMSIGDKINECIRILKRKL